jgi:hypothetical protein
VWLTTQGETSSLREISLSIAMQFRDSIRRYADAFSYRLLFAVLRGEMPALLDLDDRPPAYDDVGRTTRWGRGGLANFGAGLATRAGRPQQAEPTTEARAASRERGGRTGAERVEAPRQSHGPAQLDDADHARRARRGGSAGGILAGREVEAPSAKAARR